MRAPLDRSGIRWYLIVLGLVVGRPTAATILTGVPLLLLGVAMHLWAKGCLHQEREVTTSGPYRYVRHPFYLGNLAIDAATVIMSGSVVLLALFPFWWAAVYIPVMRREEATMAGLFGEQYQAYARRIPLLFPIARPIPAGSGFSWRNPNILAVEVPRVLRFLSYPFLFVLACEWRQSGWDFPPPVTLLTFYAVLAVLSFNLAAWQVRCVARDGVWLRPCGLAGPCARYALLLIIIAAGSLITKFEVEAPYVMIPLGVVLVCLSLLIHFRRAPGVGLDELLLLLGASVLWELPWLAAAPLVLYTGDLLAARLSPAGAPISARSQPVKGVPYRSAVFLLLLMVCLVSAFAKELVTHVP